MNAERYVYASRDGGAWYLTASDANGDYVRSGPHFDKAEASEHADEYAFWAAGWQSGEFTFSVDE